MISRASGHASRAKAFIRSHSIRSAQTTAAPPFKGAQTAGILDAIDHHAPAPITQIRPDLHPELERIIGRALEKDRDLRYQTAVDLRSELKLLQRGLDSSSAQALTKDPLERDGQSAASPVKGKKKTWLALGLFVAITAAGVWRLATNRTGENLSWSHAAASQLTGFPGAELFPALAPDGKEFVYARNEKDNWDIYQQRLTGSVARNLTENSPDDDTQPSYSPDGEWIAFRSERQGGGIFVMGATGESVRKVSNMGYYPDWSPDGKEIIFSSRLVADPFSRGGNVKLYAVNVATGETREITAGQDTVQPRWSPTGRRIAYWGRDRSPQRDIWTVSPRGGEPVRVTNDAALDWNPVWSPDSKKLAGWSADRNGEGPGSYVYSLESRRFEKIADVGMRQYWLSDNRHLICVDGGSIFLLDSKTKSARRILEMPRREIRGVSISADSRRIYFSVVTDESDIRLLTLE